MSGGPRTRLRERFPLEWRSRYRKLNRFRWIAKYRALKSFDVNPRSHPGTAARFIFLDPELDNFTYALRNESELPDFVAEVLGEDATRAAAYMYELKTDRLLSGELEQATRKRIDAKRRLEYGHRLAWYAFARSLKPRLIVETGTQNGLASVILLRALERNGEEGAPGRLLSFDIMPGTGWLVTDRFAGNWEPVIGSTFDTLAPSLAGQEVGLFIHDSLNTYDCEQFEFRTALEHAAERLVLISNRAPIGGLRDLAAARSLPYTEFHERPLHFYRGTDQAAAVYERGA